MPSTIGIAPTNGTHRQASGLIGMFLAIVAIRKMPTFAEVPIRPATAGRDRPDQRSDKSATPLGHMPPTPVQARNHKPQSCHGACADAVAAAMIEYVRMLADMALARPIRSPSLPNSRPPVAAPK